jgi:hypothetical protein
MFIKLKYDQLTCAICRRFLLRYRFLENVYCMEMCNDNVKRFASRELSRVCA